MKNIKKASWCDIEIEYIKSPLNYTGGKYKLLNQIIPLFPTNINTFIDLFAGGFNVGININANTIIYNDIDNHVVDLMKMFKETDVNILLNSIDNIIEQYNLSKQNKEGYLSLRNYYNNIDNNPIILYVIICYSFNHQIRFNKKNKYNMPFGKNKSCFNQSLRNKFIKFVNTLHNKNIVFANNDFCNFDFSNMKDNDFIYIDPPYLNSVASYNENNKWTQKHEALLLDTLDCLNKNNIKFALSNNLKYKNTILYKWKDKYNVHYIDANYKSCNYHKLNKDKDIEILVTNY